MYLATSPAVAPIAPESGRQVPLRLERAASRVFGEGRPYDPGLIQYFADLAALYGLRHRDDYFTRVRRNTFTDMIGGVLADLAPLDEPFDLVVLAHSTPDAEPGWPACFAADALPGDPLVLAVSDQGAAAAFTALRIVADYATADGFNRALVLILDQTTLMDDDQPAPREVRPTHDAVVALVLSRHADGGGPAIRCQADLGRDEAIASVTALLAGSRPAALVAGPAVGVERPGVDLVVAEPGRPCTGVWAALVDRLGDWDAGRRVVLAEYDPALRYLGTCSIETPPRAIALRWTRCRAVTRGESIGAGFDVLLESFPGGPPAGPGGHVLVRRGEGEPPEDDLPATSRELLAAEGLAVGERDPRPAVDDATWLTGLAWLRLGASEQLTDRCVAYLGERASGEGSLLDRQLVAGQLADALIEQFEIEAVLGAPGLDPPTLRRVHRRITDADRLLSRLLAASGFLSDGPGRVAYVSQLIADVWLGTESTGERG
ncbi:hypothetical protein [Amycolatopsis sp. lyj-108]|uniref:hypothetical protein n=1 Tax=Amycolatopsis sp. lyj-108 TaxID=2789286 RepID=UPI00397A8A94